MSIKILFPLQGSPPFYLFRAVAYSVNMAHLEKFFLVYPLELYRVSFKLHRVLVNTTGRLQGFLQAQLAL
jgi:hypothetical protein